MKLSDFILINLIFDAPTRRKSSGAFAKQTYRVTEGDISSAVGTYRLPVGQTSLIHEVNLPISAEVEICEKHIL